MRFVFGPEQPSQEDTSNFIEYDDKVIDAEKDGFDAEEACQEAYLTCPSCEHGGYWMCTAGTVGTFNCSRCMHQWDEIVSE